METKRNPYPSAEQKRVLVEQLKAHPDLVSGKFTNTYSRVDGRREWERIAQLLNSIPGAMKDWSQWRKCWQDLRSKAKKQRTESIRYASQTGGGPPLPPQPSTFIDGEIMDMINPISCVGHSTVEESPVQYIDWKQIPNLKTPCTGTETMLIDHEYVVLEPSQEPSMPKEPPSQIKSPVIVHLESPTVPTTQTEQIDHEYVEPSTPQRKTPSEIKSRLIIEEADKKELKKAPTANRKMRTASAKRLHTAAAASENLSHLCKDKITVKQKYFNEKLDFLRKKEAREAADARELLKIKKEKLAVMRQKEEREAAASKQLVELEKEKIMILSEISNQLNKKFM